MKAVVITTIREDLFYKFLEKWDFSGCKVFVIEGNKKKTFKLPKPKDITSPVFFHYAQEDIKKDLGKDSWIIDYKSSQMRIYGFYKAWQIGASMIYTVDDDCLPIGDVLGEHEKNLGMKVSTEWFNTMEEKLYPRGFPYNIRHKPVVMSHGLWDGIPDFDAPTQLLNPNHRISSVKTVPVPRDIYFPMCWMNLAFKSWIVPIFYAPLMGRDYPYHRFEDMWAGILIKKVLDHVGGAVVSGNPIIYHSRASDPFQNLKDEATGIEMNEIFWRDVKKIELKGKDMREAYIELANKIPAYNDYFRDMKKAMKIWVKLYEH